VLRVLARGVLGLLTRTFDFRTGAHDEGETKEIEEVKHRIFHSQKVEEAEFVLHATKEMKAWLATLHKHEDNERKENAKFRAKGGSCTLWRGQALTRVASTIAFHPAWYQPVWKSFLGDDAAALARPERRGTGTSTPSSRHRVGGVEDDATIQHERAVKFDFHTGTSFLCRSSASCCCGRRRSRGIPF
jgi:hypothetical protein